MLEQKIQLNREDGLIASVVVIFQSGKWIIGFAENEKSEKDRPVDYFLTLQRTDAYREVQFREFAKLETAASVLRKLGFSEFRVKLELLGR